MISLQAEALFPDIRLARLDHRSSIMSCGHFSGSLVRDDPVLVVPPFQCTASAIRIIRTTAAKKPDANFRADLVVCRQSLAESARATVIQTWEEPSERTDFRFAHHTLRRGGHILNTVLRLA